LTDQLKADWRMAKVSFNFTLSSLRDDPSPHDDLKRWYQGATKWFEGWVTIPCYRCGQFVLKSNAYEHLPSTGDVTALYCYHCHWEVFNGIDIGPFLEAYRTHKEKKEV
jgi:hypothetical protein